MRERCHEHFLFFSFLYFNLAQGQNSQSLSALLLLKQKTSDFQPNTIQNDLLLLLKLIKCPFQE